MTAKNLTQIALMTALMCILCPMTIPVGPIPISLAPLMIFLSVFILGTKRGTLAVALYLLIGLAGVPVLSGFTGGAARLFGPTGGYMIGYIFMALISGWFINRYYDRIPVQVLGMLLGLAVLYTFGTLWLKHQAGMTLQAAAAAGVWPFVGLDLLKIAAAVVIGRAVRSGLTKAGLLDLSPKSLNKT